jgi:quinol monooxygenase YgiN
MSVTIEAGTKQLTMLNIYEVRKAKQQKLIDLLDRVAKEMAHKQAGLISFVIHRSFDGTRVVNYSQWVSREAFEKALANPEARKHLEAAMAVAINTPIFCEVVSVYEGSLRAVSTPSRS